MKKITKRAIAFLSATAMTLSLVACSGNNVDNGMSASDEKIPDGKLFAPDTNISIVIGSHTSWPYEEDWTLWNYLREASGANLEVTAIPNENYDTKVNLMLASPETLPDLIHTSNKAGIVDVNGPIGAFVSIDDNMEKMPHFSAYIESLPEAERADVLNQRRSGDGKIYFAPVTGTDRLTNLRTWMYRKDIFEANNLTVPTTMDELYDVSMKLKSLYPDSYPLCFRSGLTQIDVMGPAWRSGFNSGIFYDFENESWHYGAQEPEMLEIVKFFIKMNEAGLVPPDYLTIDAKGWEALVSTNRGFIMPEYLVRLDFFNLPARKDNPEFTLAIMDPPKGSGDKAQHKIAKLNLDPDGYVICNTGNQSRIDNAIKLIDWMYSDEGSHMLSWGKEGETYEVVDGKKKFILADDETAQQAYGIGTYGLYLRMDPEAYAAAYSEEQSEQGKIAYENTEANANPNLWLAFNDEEMAVKQQYAVALNDYKDEALSKFLLGQRPLSEWDSFVAGLKDMNVDGIIGIYESAYARAMGK